MSVSTVWVVTQFGLRVPVTVGVLQFEVGAVSLLLPSQTEFRGQLLLSPLPPPLAALPNSKADKHKDEDKASEEDVRPPTQNPGLEFFLLLALGNRGFLALIGRE